MDYTMKKRIKGTILIFMGIENENTKVFEEFGYFPLVFITN